MDPQGQILHEMIEGVVNSMDDKFTSVFSSVLLNCGQVRLDGITIRVRYLNDSHAFVLRATDLRLGPEFVFGSSLFRGLVGSLVSSRKKSNLFVTCAELDVSLEENDSMDSAASFTGVSALVRLDNLQLSALGIHVPNASLQISPKFAPSLMVVLDITSQKGDYRARNGSELWKIAAEMLDNSVVLRRFSLRKALSYAALWRQYAHAYVLLLTSVGYPLDKATTRNCSRMSRNRRILDTIREHWDTVIDLEEKIPVEAVARARRAARSELTVSLQLSKQDSSKALILSYMLKVISPLLYLWRFLVFVWWSLLAIIGRGNKADSSCAYILPSAVHDVDKESQLSIHLGELSVTLLPVAASTDSSGAERLNIGYKTSQTDLPYARLVIKSSCLLQSAGCTTHSLFFVIGEIKICLSGVPKLLQNSNTPRRSHLGRAEFPEDNDSKMILWSDSASMQPFSGQQANGSTSDLSTALLTSDIDEIWSNWMIVSNLYKESGVIHLEKPSVIVELKSFLIDPHRSTGGFKQCRFTVGRLNLDLDYLCASSTYLLYSQFVHYKQLKERAEEIQDLSNSSGAHVASTGTIDETLRLFSHIMKVSMLDAIPESTLQVAALVDGPFIRLSLDKNSLLQNGKNVHKSLVSEIKSNSSIVLSLEYVECALCPVSRFSPTHLSHIKKSHNSFVSAKEPHEPHQLQKEINSRDISGHAMHDAHFSFAGLALLIDNPEANQRSHVFGPMSVNLQLSTSRNYISSFFGTKNIISANLGAGIVGCTVFFYMDELLTVCQLFESMYSESLKSGLVNFTYSQDFMGRFASFYKRSIMGSTMELNVDHVAQEETPDPHIELSVEMQLDLESADIIFCGSRGFLPNLDTLVNSALNYISGSPALEGMATQELLDTLALGVGFCIRSSSVKLLLDGECTDFLISISGIHCMVFEDEAQMSILSGLKQHGAMLKGSLHSKNQLFVSDCVFHLHGGPNKDNLTHEKLQDEPGRCCVSASLGMFYSIKFEFTEVYVGDYGIHNYLTEFSQHRKQKLSLLIHDDFQLFKCNIQGGLIFLEAISLSKLVFCCKVYFWLVMNLPLQATSNLVKDSVTSISAGSDYTVTNKYEDGEVATVSFDTHLQNEESQLNAVKCLDVELSRFSLTLVVADESGTYQGLRSEIAGSFQRMNLGTKFLFQVKRLSVSTACGIHTNDHELSKDVPAPRFRSGKSVDSPSQSEIQEYLPFMEADNMLTYGDAPSSSSVSESSTGNTSLDFSSKEYYILKHFSSHLKIEKKILDDDTSLAHLSGDWFGNGSISGLEVTMSLSNVEMISSLLAPFHRIMSSGSTQKGKQTTNTTQQAHLDNLYYL